jgi:hypothetical protein
MPTAAATRRSRWHPPRPSWSVARSWPWLRKKVIAAANRCMGAVLITRRDTQRGRRPLTAGAAARLSGLAPPHG